MKTYDILMYVKRIRCLIFMMFLLASCTYDYFEDETNFWLYIPQVKNNEIKNFYVAFHDEAGRPVRTRSIVSPFDKESFMKDGILRFKLYPGEYAITCFADYAPGSITDGEPLAVSYKAEEQTGTGVLYTTRSGEIDPRALFFNKLAYPLGDPAGREPVEADLSDLTRYRGEVVTRFIDLPAIVGRIDILYSGISTKFRFDGTFDRFTPQDQIISTFSSSSFAERNNIIFTDKINPSVGINFKDYLASGSIEGADPLRLEVRFYALDGMCIGTTFFSEEDIVSLPPDKRPTDKQGNPVTSLVLEPQKGFVFIFKGFNVFQIELIGWGDITDGEITPM